MTDRNLPPIADALAFWHQGKIKMVLHGMTYADDRAAELTPIQALRLAETLTRAAREALAT